ncbi:putative Cell division control protein 15 [Hypsibius exemplaris]|uniref:non-specific serine/threonine protein kinase n=1 Tax=Hypsibius exemplaris TaxID=2072580 RepID=A0A9X6NBG8_HYPEX|nr:putative Cell division control protein 15 [Hypsibius exemplaris]
MKEYGFRRTPTDYTHCLEGRGSFGYISTVDAFYLDDGNPVAEHAVNQAYRLLLETVEHASNQDNHYCLLMEWCSGITLRNFIERNPTHCSTKRIVTYTFQVASALHYLHEGNKRTKFVHGNITSSNIMMKESTGENVKIIDIEGAFQQPRGKRQSKKQFNVEGSFYFMSPEMAAWLDESSRKVTRPTPDSPTDIYSLGCVIMDMYFASQGQALWPDHDVSSIRSALQSDHPLIPRMPENSPDEIKVLARQCLQVNPSDRPTAATILNYVARVYGNPHFKCAEDGIQYYLPNSKKLLGNIGAFGVVHRVDAFSVGADLVKQSKRYLALKTFFQKLEQDEIENIETTLLKLNHPNIVKYLAAGFFEHDHQFIMIMECCSGGTLRKAAETALPVEKQKYYVNQLICGIHYLHINDPPIVHKNLKGSNVVFSDENKSTLKICDVDSCSVSRRVDQQSVISRVRFTEGFASPELWKWWNKFDKKGEYPVGRATDIWSLGAVVLEMYCRGNLPDIPSFQRGEILRTTTVADANVDIPPIGEELLAFAAKCLVNEPEKRPTIEQLRDKFSKGFSTASSSARKSDSITVMIEIGKGNSDIFFKDSDGYDNICRPTADNPYFGRGRFGHVIKVNAFYLNPHPVPRENHAETYALKILNRQVAPRDGRTDKLETLLHLEHEHVIGYIAVGTTTDGVCHILMEFCSGMKLNEFIKSNAMYCTNNDIVDYTFQLASGLRYLHGKRTKFIHGDIKSTNILMKDSTGKILKIVDLDRSFQRKPGPRLPGEEMEVMEPCTFMSPEMMVWLADDDRRNRRRPPDISTDIWSLGCVVLDMYLMREGQEVLWFNERLLDFDALLVNIKARIYLGPQIPEDMPDELKVLAGHCLKVNPDDRPTAATLVKYADRVYYKCTGSLIQYYLRPSIGEYDLWGGFGIVQRVKAFSVDAGFVEEGPRYLALKTFHQALHEDEIVKIQTLPKLEHSNIVRYFTKLFFDQDSRYRLIMEWCSGGTLTEAAAAERGLSVEQQKTYTNQLIQGIHYLHVEVKPSIVYKDLKGINVVFLDKNKTTLKICDLDSFSVSRKVGQQSYISRVRFTRGFASPELFKLADMFAFKGDYPVGRATDIWSLGAVVLEMYCKGILPMPEYNTLDDNFPSTPAPYKPAIPEDMQQELKSFVSKCMALLPKDRPIIQDLRDDFSDG